MVDVSYEDTVDLEIADDVVTTWMRAAVRDKVLDTLRPGHRRPRPRARRGHGAGRRRGPRPPGRHTDTVRTERAWTPTSCATGRHPERRERHLPPVVPVGHTGRAARTTPQAETRRKGDRGIHPRAHPALAPPVGAFAGIVVALYALVFLTGDHRPTPKLGIDLQGGTRVTLTARTESGGEPPREQLLQAQSIIEQRVNGLGVSGAEVVLDGTNLTITVPGDKGDQARSLGQTAQLRFREVVGGPVAAGPAAPASPAPSRPPATRTRPSTRPLRAARLRTSRTPR